MGKLGGSRLEQKTTERAIVAERAGLDVRSLQEGGVGVSANACGIPTEGAPPVAGGKKKRKRKYTGTPTLAPGTKDDSGQPSARQKPAVSADDAGRGCHKGSQTAAEVLGKLHELCPKLTLTRCSRAGCKCECFELAASDTAGRCRCGHAACSHEMQARQRGKGQSGDLLLELFVCVRNARAAGAAVCDGASASLCFNWGDGWFAGGQQGRQHGGNSAVQNIQRAQVLAKQAKKKLYGGNDVLDALARAERLCSGKDKPEPPKGVPSRHADKARGVLVAAQLDLAYWHVYYSALTSDGAKESVPGDPHARVAVPSPAVYFSVLCCELPSSDALSSLLGDNAPLLAELRTVFDLDTRSPGPLRLPINTNPLLAVLQATWLEMSVHAHALEWLGAFPLSDSPAEGTMRKSDPRLPWPLRQRCDALRDWSARVMAFAVPNAAALRCVAERAGGSTVVEIGAGTGYWARCLRDAGVLVHAVDKDPPATGGQKAGQQHRGKLPGQAAGSMNDYHGHSPAWSAVKSGGAETLRQPAHASAVLLCCYPPPEGTFAADMLRAYKGDLFLYVGELTGDTGTPSFEAQLRLGWALESSVDLPCFANTASKLMVFARRSSQLPARSLHSCCVCGASEGGIRRCRVTRALSFCSAACLARGQPQLRLQLNLRHLPLKDARPPEKAFPDMRVL